MELLLKEIVGEYQHNTCVEGIMLGGSRSTESEDQLSDYNLYVYHHEDISVSERQQITNKFCRYMELNNQFWEVQDDGQLNDGSEIIIVYRNLIQFDRQLHDVAFRYQARLGATTAHWYNFLHAEILFDRNGRLAELQQKYSIAYPFQLQSNILQKNHALLRRQMPAYLFKIEKALVRQDRVSLNNLLSRFMASYFDIVFAVNEQLHPGDKKLVSHALRRCNHIPKNFESRLNRCFELAGGARQELLAELNLLIDELDHMIKHRASSSL
ncbi:DUF4037 domain-containing protein [Gynuella sunshinyii]|uniref:DUF4037 domain-containing protein n=1 Tax=Gynuella sunshinyii YC6258 TaxID=1445510 RepID=A0A0C5VE37_9GAMM|nr:DUF4037 domain-containing protein [Gynuella sunshinyii]AJQ92481.1 hypothetical Protein YC6258_00431 [Gynuella sunshinyii YC6258]